MHQTAAPRRRSGPLPLVALALSGLLATACGGKPTDTSIRTTTPSGSFTSPSGQQAAERDRALLRVVSAMPGASRLDLFVEGEKIAAGVEYRTITPFLNVAAGRQSLRLRPAGLDTAEPLAEETRQLDAGRYYTVVIMPGDENGPAATVHVFEDPMDPPDENRAVLRFVHAASDAGRIDVSLQGRPEAVATGLEFQQASAFVDIEPSAAPIAVRPAQRTETMFQVPDQKLAAAGIYTIILVGRTRIAPPLETLVIEDRLVRP